MFLKQNKYTYSRVYANQIFDVGVAIVTVGNVYNILFYLTHKLIETTPSVLVNKGILTMEVCRCTNYPHLPQSETLAAPRDDQSNSPPSL